MGLTFVRIRVSKDASAPSESLEVLVDTGATYTMIPGPVLERLGLVPTRAKRVRLGDGRVIGRRLGLGYVRYETYESPTWILFGDPDDTPVLGALTLEELSLQVDMESQRLRETDTVLMVSAG